MINRQPQKDVAKTRICPGCGRKWTSNDGLNVEDKDLPCIDCENDTHGPHTGVEK